MSIEINSKWVKDGEVVIIENLGNFCSNKEILNFSGSSDVVQFRQCNISIIEIMYISKFLEQYKPYEVVYEYQYVYMDTDNRAETTVSFYKDDVEFFEAYNGSFNKSYQRLDFTKRERKQ